MTPKTAPLPWRGPGPHVRSLNTWLLGPTPVHIGKSEMAPVICSAVKFCAIHASQAKQDLRCLRCVCCVRSLMSALSRRCSPVGAVAGHFGSAEMSGPKTEVSGPMDHRFATRPGFPGMSRICLMLSRVPARPAPGRQMSRISR